jgi:multidrug transporter EmrE-like cation transporter
MEYQLILLLLVGGTFLTAGDITAQKWMGLSGGNFSISTHYYLLSLLFYAAGVTLFALSLKHKSIAIATIILIFFNLLTVAIVGYYFFDQKLSMLQMLGIAVGFLSVVILEIAG